MALDISGNLFNQRDVRESAISAKNPLVIKNTSNILNTTTSASYVDVTSSEVTITGLNAGKTYTLIGIGTTQQSSGSNCTAGLNIKIISSFIQFKECSIRSITPTEANNVIGILTGETGATSYTAILRHKTSTGTLTTKGELTLIAIEE